MHEQKVIIGCDWGTSSFRLKIASIQDGILLAEAASSDGIATVHQNWLNAQAIHPTNQSTFFLRFLSTRITELIEQLRMEVSIEAVVASGMASSTIGLIDLSYAGTPFPLSGQQAVYEKIEAGSANPYPVYVISGLRHFDEVMRGEETQLIGISAILQQMSREDCTCILPGTHSKHIKIRQGNITEFRTYLTGELFNIMRRHSVLGKSVSELNTKESLPDSAKSAFEKGVRKSIGNNLLNTVFGVRTNQLFNRLSKTDNYYFLSGLLIGAELQELARTSGERIVLAAGHALFPFYQQTINILKLDRYCTFLDPKEVEAAATAGQLKLYKNIFLNSTYEHK